MQKKKALFVGESSTLSQLLREAKEEAERVRDEVIIFSKLHYTSPPSVLNMD